MNITAPLLQTTPPSSSDVAFEPGAFIERYELLTRIAEGGMAVVWLARVTGSFGFEKLVAVKTIRPHFAKEDNYQRMFLDESNIAAHIRHPNVVEVHDVGVSNGVPYQVLEWIDGDALAGLHRVALRRGKKIPQNIALKIVAQVCAGLHSAHDLAIDGAAQNVVHRDVSPQNVLVSRAGQVKLIDFGIAKASERLTEDTVTGIVKGKVSYIAPEQARGQTVDHRADIWACGVMLHQLLFGATPVRKSQRGRGALASLGVASEFKDADPELQYILKKALARDPEARFRSAREMELELERLAQRDGPVTAADIARSLAPLREQGEARQIVIEDALRASRERQSEKEERESQPIVYEPTMGSIAPPARDSFESHSGDSEILRTRLTDFKHSARSLAKEAWIQGLSNLARGMTRTAALIRSRPPTLTAVMGVLCALLLLGVGYGSGYSSGAREAQSQATAPVPHIEVSLEHVPVCKLPEATVADAASKKSDPEAGAQPGEKAPEKAPQAKKPTRVASNSKAQ